MGLTKESYGFYARRQYCFNCKKTPQEIQPNAPVPEFSCCPVCGGVLRWVVGRYKIKTTKTGKIFHSYKKEVISFELRPEYDKRREINRLG